jgi:uncharacterized protein (UPF0332 family)
MTARDFLTLADRLVTGATEAEWRSAVSRAYYAAFHVARELLTGLGFTVPRQDRAHRHLIYRLTNCGDPGVSQAGRDLDALRGDRNDADYDFNRPVSAAQAPVQVRLAERVIQTLEAAAQEPTRTRITDAMKVYERDVLQDVTWHP